MAQPESVISKYLSEFSQHVAKIEATDKIGGRISLTGAISCAMDLVNGQTKKGKKLIFIGNGGTAATASHQATDFWKNGGMRAIAFNDSSLLTCISNDFGYPHVFEKPIEMFADSGDVLFAISSSGQSENILRAVKAAQARGLSVVSLSGFKPDNPLRGLGDLRFYVPSMIYNYVEILHMLICSAVLDCLNYSKFNKFST